ncbi:MAG: hypothetical protein FWH41_01430 [Treponema sp.]|nr:hypothetical protein [Treponema sp.]
MGRIKSALEIALERTESVKTNKASIGLYQAKQEGIKIANAFLTDPSINLDSELKKRPEELRESFKQGIFDVLYAQISLPAALDDMQRIQAAGKGLQLLIDDKHFSQMYKQFTQVLSQFIEETAQYDQMIRQQYAPKLRQKEEELSRRLGREVKLDPLQDPEFINFYNQNLNALKANYQTFIDQVKDEALKIWNEKKE